MKNPTQTDAWGQLSSLSKKFNHADFRLSDLFEKEEDRFALFSQTHENLLLDYSKNFITREIMEALQELAKDMQLQEAIEAMFDGNIINLSEGQAALHTALRLPEGKNPHPEVIDCLNKMDSFVARIHSGEWRGHSGQKIRDIVNLGIGGSDLGPSFICDTLKDYSLNVVNIHFVSNIDPAHLDDTLENLNPETTLFIVASKSFKTLETHQNALTAREWILASSQNNVSIQKHFIAITKNLSAAQEFGIHEENLYPIWDWVGGRFSLWSAIGIPIALSIGMAQFKELLSGAHSMDMHFRNTPFNKNLPVIMAMLAIWYRCFFNARSSAIIPYSERLKKLPIYLQQLYMESLGKNVTNEGEAVSTSTAEILWGTVGTDSQHSYFQLLHQGTEFVPIDFIAVAEPATQGFNAKERHQHLLSNCFSQSLALMKGSLKNKSTHEFVAGNKTSNTLLLKKLNPYNIGNLIALYEHKIFVQSVIWNINAFDQWGVELGKMLSTQLFNGLNSDIKDKKIDSSTKNLIEFVKVNGQ